MSSSANLDIVAATSFRYGDITDLVRQQYLIYTRANPNDTSNRWSVVIPAIIDQGVIAWRVRYPYGPAVPANDFGWTSVQTTLCDYSARIPTVIDYDPTKLYSKPQTSSTTPFIAAMWWGNVDRTLVVQNLLASDHGSTSFTFNLSQTGSPPTGSGSTTLVFMVYGYVITDTTVVPPSRRLQLGAYFGRQSNPTVTISKVVPPRLSILGAVYSYSNVSDRLTSFVSDQQTLSIDLSRLNSYFRSDILPGDNGPNKVLSILYRYDSGDIKCWASGATTGSLSISLGSQPTNTSPNLLRRPHAGESNVLAIVWGNGSGVSPQNPQWPLAEVYDQKIFNSPSFSPTLAFFDNISPGPSSTCHLYYQYGVSGDIHTAAASTMQTITMIPRTVQGFDPPPAKALLRPTSPSPCYTLRTSAMVSISLQSVASNSTWQLVADNGPTPAIFMVVPTSTTTEFNAPFAMLKVYVTASQKWAYLGQPSGSVWSQMNGSTASFMVPGQNCSNDPKDWALAFNYEIPSRNDRDGLMFTASQYRSGSQAGYSAQFLVLHQNPGSTSITLNSLQTALQYLPGTSLGPRFVANPQVSLEVIAETRTVNASDGDYLDSCLVATLSILKFCSWDLICTMCGLWSVANPIGWVEKICKWWQALGPVARAGLLAVLQVAQTNFQMLAENAQDIPEVKLFSQGMTITGNLYNGDTLWSLCKALLSDFSWWDFGKLALNIVSIALEIIQPAAGVYAHAVAVALWFANAQVEAWSWVKACISASAAQAIRATAIASKVGTAMRTAKVMALHPSDRDRVMIALTSPLMHQMINEEKPIGGSHPLLNYGQALRSDAGLQKEHLDDPFIHLYSGLSPDARLVAEELTEIFASDEEMETHEESMN